MADAEGVVRTLLARGERRGAVLRLPGVDGVAAAGEDLVRIALVANVPYDAVVRRVVQRVQGDGQLDHAQAGAEMTAGPADRFDQVGTQLVGDGGQFGFVELAQVGRAVDAREARIAQGIDHAAIFLPVVAVGKARSDGTGGWRDRAPRDGLRAVTCRAGGRPGHRASTARPARRGSPGPGRRSPWPGWH